MEEGRNFLRPTPRQLHSRDQRPPLKPASPCRRQNRRCHRRLLYARKVPRTLLRYYQKSRRSPRPLQLGCRSNSLIDNARNRSKPQRLLVSGSKQRKPRARQPPPQRLVNNNSKRHSKPPQLARNNKRYSKPPQLAHNNRRHSKPPRRARSNRPPSKPPQLVRNNRQRSKPPRLVRNNRQHSKPPQLAHNNRRHSKPPQLVRSNRPPSKPPQLVRNNRQRNRPPQQLVRQRRLALLVPNMFRRSGVDHQVIRETRFSNCSCRRNDVEQRITRAWATRTGLKQAKELAAGEGTMVRALITCSHDTSMCTENPIRECH